MPKKVKKVTITAGPYAGQKAEVLEDHPSDGSVLVQLEANEDGSGGLGAHWHYRSQFEEGKEEEA